EARVLMLSANNVLSPANGRPLTVPSQDMVIGIYYLTEKVAGAKGEGRRYRHLWEIEQAYDNHELEVHAEIQFSDGGFDDDGVPTHRITTPGRLLFEAALPPDFAERFGYIDKAVKKRHITDIVEKLVDEYTKATVAKSLDAIKDIGFRFASQSGLTISMDDVKNQPEKAVILDRYEKEADKIEAQFKRGIITDDERRQKEVEIWINATEEVRRAMQKTLGGETFNPIDMMLNSGARGNIMQVSQIAGMRGLVANPRGEIIPRPIKSNFREGMSVLEYFISTHGARKGLADTALRTADSGYLTRRLVDVAQELIIRSIDCGSTRGLWLENVSADRPDQRSNLETRLYGRTLVDAVTLADGRELPANTTVGEPEMAALRDDPDVNRVRVRSVLTCEATHGVCGLCYGRSMATGKAIELGEAVGVIAAQSIGEPGTQLTMRTFHTGGIAGEDITHGLPRVVELFEARTPKGKAVLARTSGAVRLAEDDVKGRTVTIVGDDGSEESYPVSTRDVTRLLVRDNQEVAAGDALIEGPKDPKELLEIKGIRDTQQYLVDQVQLVYRAQGVSIHDKHIELIVRQMLRRVLVAEAGESEFLPGERVDARQYADVNRSLVTADKRPAQGRPELMGITKASLATESWLSAASFQETTRVLTEAAIEGKCDQLMGLKENIIIGKLIPAGTGMERYRNLDIHAPDYEPLSYYSSDNDQDLAAWLANIGTTGEGGTPPDGAGTPSGPAPVTASPAEFVEASPEDAAS
ncbi:MAG: DNA-directed RNA polymerase subunit beta', partial [Acidimicrobiales bacterium]